MDRPTENPNSKALQYCCVVTYCWVTMEMKSTSRCIATDMCWLILMCEVRSHKCLEPYFDSPIRFHWWTFHRSVHIDPFLTCSTRLITLSLNTLMFSDAYKLEDLLIMQTRSLNTRLHTRLTFTSSRWSANRQLQHVVLFLLICGVHDNYAPDMTPYSFVTTPPSVTSIEA
jgi:hypothetical protein